jgi:pimeloyl-ACP methyl ester carboxylesterase
MGSILKMIVERCAQTSIYHPPPASYQKTSVNYIKSVRGDRLAIRCISPPNCSMSLNSKYRDERRVILYSHGNACDIGGCTDTCELMARMLDAHVIVYDYPNYGASSKTAICESVLNSSIEAVYNRCMELQIPDENLILMGQSLGSVPTLHLASRVYAKYATVILISPLASAFRTVVDENYFPKFLASNLDNILFNNLKAIENIHAPLALVHGFSDDVIDISSSEALHSKIPQRYKHAPLYISAGHNDIFDEENLGDVSKYLQEFIRDACQPATSSDALQD